MNIESAPCSGDFGAVARRSEINGSDSAAMSQLRDPRLMILRE